jgi:exodeoxyribonuclease-3
MTDHSLKIMSFNVNGLRSRLDQFSKVIAQHQPDFIGLQETKVSDDEFPHDAINELGYKAEIFGQKGHYGVALLSRTKPQSVQLGFNTDDEEAQRRMIHCTYEINNKRLHIINGYFPQGESRSHPTKFPAKEQFYRNLLVYLNQNFDSNDLVLVLGDMNVAPEDIDIGIKPENARRWLKTGKCAFLPEEREWLQALLNWGLVDTYRSDNPSQDQSYSWFDYRSRGFEQEPKRGLRIDLILASQPVLERLSSTGIDFQARAMERPSDHCPVWVDLNL